MSEDTPTPKPPILGKPQPAPVAQANAAAASFAALLERLSYLDASAIQQVRSAYRFADQSHLGQMRKNGEPYITHPIAVASQCTEWKLDAEALMAALLHDAMEDCGVTKLDLVERFGASVADLVDGLTKLDKLHFSTREENQAESFRKMLLAMARDVRVILIKLADRTHNMRTMGDMPREKWGRIASETLDIYVPIAHRLGLNQTYRELQDLAFRHLRPWRYEVLARAVARARSRRRDLIQKVQGDVQAAFAAVGMDVRTAGREKSLYSIYRKMEYKRLSFAQVTDIYGLRIIVPSMVDCYTGLGVVHQLYKPVPGKFKDYIAIPKLNGYQSLHTTVVGPSGVNIEFQLRTEDMHAVAETGVAAHWLYKASDPNGPIAKNLGAKWLQSLLDIQNETRDATEFWDHVKVDLFPDAIYVFTPKGKIMGLPRGATVVDLAYQIHSNVGDHATGGIINGTPEPLRTELRSGDVVTVETDPEASPNPAWLGFARTGKARSKIRHYLKTLAQVESEALGEKLLTQSVRAEGLEKLPDQDGPHQALWDKLLRMTGNKSRSDLLTDVGLGKRIASMVAKRLVVLMIEQGEKPDALLLTRERFTAHETISQGAVALDGSEGASVQYGQCCRPVPGDPIVGYLGRGEGLVVHHQDCGVAKRLRHKDAERFLHVEWADEPVRAFETGLIVTIRNAKGALAQVTRAIADTEADIAHLDMDEEAAQQDAPDLRILLRVRDSAHLEQVMRAVRRSSAVQRVERIQSAG